MPQPPTPPKHPALDVIISLRWEGFHCWPEAPEPVDFLRNRHRHIFHIRCWKNVTHANRDVEIILFKRAVENYLAVHYHGGELGSKSCEMLAIELGSQFDCTVEVLEDGENGAVYYPDWP